MQCRVLPPSPCLAARTIRSPPGVGLNLPRSSISRKPRIPSSVASDVAQQEPETKEELPFASPTTSQRFWTSFRLFFALPWRRFRKGSVLTFTLSDEVDEVPPSSFSDDLSLPVICEALIKAAYDPRVKGLFVKIKPVTCGWAKLTEIRRHIEFFNASGKFSMAYMELGGEKEYYVAAAFEEIYFPPSANIYLRGLTVSGTFLRGALDKAGIEPQVKRIGNYKSSGDQLLREEMSEYQKEQLQALLDDLYNGFVHEVAQSRHISAEEVEEVLNKGVIAMEDYQKAGFITELKYKDEVVDMLKERLKIKENNKLKRVSLSKYRNVPPSTFGLNRAKKAIAVVRASGAISSASSNLPVDNSTIDPSVVIRDIKRAAEKKNIVAIVLRVDSPGGEALGSDLMWREIRQACEKKPIIASMADLAASGGYYMAMAAQKIVAEKLTLTGSIGVVLTKVNIAELYKKLGIGKETLSRGKYAELFAENRSFTEEEDAYWSELANHAYVSFRNKAAASRGLTPDQMQEYAQGRVWSGLRAEQNGLVDAIGGIHRAIAMAKEEANLKESDQIRVIEFSQQKGSVLEKFKAISFISNGIVSALFLTWGLVSLALSKGGTGLVRPAICVLLGGLGFLQMIPKPDDKLWEYTMEDIKMGESKLQETMPQAIMSEDLRSAAKSLSPVLAEALKKLL